MMPQDDEYAQTFHNEVAIDNEAITPEDLAELAPAEEGKEDKPLDEPLDIQKETQRLKSWEGRLKAREAQLKEREKTAAAAPASGTPSAEEAAAAVEQAAQAIADGAPSDQVFANLQEEFGEDFAHAINALVDSKLAAAQEQMGGINEKVENLISALRSDRQRQHFEYIAERHPDFMAIADSEPFQAWLHTQDEDAQHTVSAGSARQVCALLEQFKAGQQAGQGTQSTKEPKPEPKPEDMAAIAVTSRSAGLRLPAKPATADDYLSAWHEA